MEQKRNLFTQDLIIKSIDDVNGAIDKVLEHPDSGYRIILENVEPVVFRLIGDRFEQEYVTIRVIDIANEYKTNFVKYFREILKSELRESELSIRVQRNSFEFDIAQFFGTIIEKGIDKMSGGELTLIILFAIGAWFAKEAFGDYLKNKESQYTSEIAKEAIKTLRENMELQKAKNKPVKTALELLEDDEKLEYGNEKDKATYTRTDIDSFDYAEDEQITYETIEDEFYITGLKDKDGKKYIELKRGKRAKFEAISKLNNNSKLYDAFDKRKPIRLKVNIGKNNKGKIIEADIFEIVADIK